MKDHVEIGHLTKCDAFRVNRYQVMDLEIWLKIHYLKIMDVCMDFEIHLLRRRANARNVSFRISLRWLTYIINSVDKTKLSYIGERSKDRVHEK